MAVSKLNMGFTEYDDGAVFRCVATSSIMAAQESKPLAQITLSVQCKSKYSARNKASSSDNDCLEFSKNLIFANESVKW